MWDFSDRGILRDTFLLTMAKTPDEKRALGECFDLFFDQPEPAQSAPEAANDDESQANEPSSAEAAGGETQATEGLGPLAQMLLRQDRNEIAAALAGASSAPRPCPTFVTSPSAAFFPAGSSSRMGIQRLRRRS